MYDYYVTAVSHVDMAFTMREEAHEEMLNILLERVIQILDRNPKLCFGIEQAAHYRKLEKRRPDLFFQVRRLIQEGRMEFLGGMATTAETNFPDGECLVRNLGMGLHWVRGHLGAEPKVGWLVDTFGLNPQIPQIMRQFGFHHLHASRFGGDKRYDMFVAHGLDGSEILVIGRDGYSMNVRHDTLAMVFCRNYADIDALFQQADSLTWEGPKLVVYYIENEEQFSEYYLKLTDERNGATHWKHASFSEYSQVLEEYGYSVPTLSADLNPEFTGTFALRTAIKTENRRAERTLLEAELWSTLLDYNAGTRLEDCWWELFFCQFHDVFSGSHEDRTYRNVMGRLRQVQGTAGDVLRESVMSAQDGDRFLCVNSLPWARREWVEAENAAFLVEVPACGMAVYAPAKADPPQVIPGNEISNEHLRLVLSENEGIRCLEGVDGTVYISGTPNLLVVQEDLGGMQIERCNGQDLFAVSGEIKVGPITRSASGSSILLSGRFPEMPWNKGSNKLSWSILFTLRPGDRALRMRIRLDWEGMGSRVRLKIPAAFEVRDVFHEVPFGVARRSAYRSRPTAKGEWPVHRFAAMESGDRGIALVNRGVAGVEQEGDCLATTLIRAYGDADDPWITPTPLSSQWGEHTYDFLLIPYAGGYRDNDVISMAQAFNQPVTVLKTASALPPVPGSLLSLDNKRIVLSTVKKAWDGTGDVVVRLYESAGETGQCTLITAGLKRAYASDLAEKRGPELPHNGERLSLHFTPYEIKTIRLQRGGST